MLWTKPQPKLNGIRRTILEAQETKTIDKEDFTFLDDAMILYRRWVPVFYDHHFQVVEVQLYLSQSFVRTSPMHETRGYINRAVAAILTKNGAEIPR